MRSLRTAPTVVSADWLAWRDTNHPAALVRRWRGAWRRFWAGVATMGEGPAPMHLTPGTVCPWCRLRALAMHCTSPRCPWVKCPGCLKTVRPDLFEKEEP